MKLFYFLYFKKIRKYEMKEIAIKIVDKIINISFKISISKINILSAELQLESAKKDIRYQFLNLLDLIRTNLKMLEIENSTKNSAKENLFLAMERLKLAQTTAIEVRDAQLSYENSLTRLCSINNNLKLAETHLKLLMGEL